MTAQHTAGGALAFAAYFINALDWSLATTDPYLIKQVSTLSCRPCYEYIDRLSSIQLSDGHLEGGRVSIRSVELSSGTLVKADFVVDVLVSQQNAVVIEPGSAPSTEVASENPVTDRLYLSWLEDHWMVLEIGAPA